MDMLELSWYRYPAQTVYNTLTRILFFRIILAGVGILHTMKR